MRVLYSYVKKKITYKLQIVTLNYLMIVVAVSPQKWIRNVCKLTLKSLQGMLLKGSQHYLIVVG